MPNKTRSMMEAIHWIMVVIILKSAIVKSNRMTVSMETCGTKINIDEVPSTELYLPRGNTQQVNDCSFEFTSGTFDHDTCFRVESSLTCAVTLEYRTFTHLVDKKITCDSYDYREEHCGIFTSMSVIFFVKDGFYLHYPIIVQVYQKKSKKDNESYKFADSNYVFIGLGFVGVVFLVVVFTACSYHLRRQNGGCQSLPQPAQNQDLSYVPQPLPSRIDYHDQRRELLPFSSRRQPENNSAGDPSVNHTQEDYHGYPGYRANCPQQPPNYPADNNFPGPQSLMTPQHLTPSAPPPPYEEAKNFPKPSVSCHDVKAVCVDPADQQEPPPPPYPGI